MSKSAVRQMWHTLPTPHLILPFCAGKNNRGLFSVGRGRQALKLTGQVIHLLVNKYHRVSYSSFLFSFRHFKLMTLISAKSESKCNTQYFGINYTQEAKSFFFFFHFISLAHGSPMTAAWILWCMHDGPANLTVSEGATRAGLCAPFLKGGSP